MFKLTHKLLNFQLASRFFSAETSDLHGTLHFRFLEHLKKNQHFKNQELSSLIDLFKDDPKRFGSRGHIERCKEIDRTCLHNLHQKKREEITGQLDTIIEAMPGVVTNLKSFHEALAVLLQKFDSNPSTREFVHLSFYLGLLKKKSPGPEMLNKLIKRYLDEAVPHMSTTDFAIFCTACYKASLRIESMNFKNRLVEEIIEMKKIDQHFYVAFIKSLRMNEINALRLFKTLKKQSKAGMFDEIELKPLVHIFALVADNGIADTELSSYFSDLCIARIEEDSRVKDIQKFLYSCALLNVSLKKSQLKKLEDHLKVKMKQTEYEKWFDNFVDAILSLWMLGMKSQELIETLLKDPRFHYTGDRSRVKIDSRKKLLLTCVEIERPEWVESVTIAEPSFNEERQAPSYLVTPALHAAMKKLRRNSVFVQQILHLNIAGILVKEPGRKSIHYEVLDNRNLLSDLKTPNGILALKLRLLKHKNCQVRLENPVSR